MRRNLDEGGGLLMAEAVMMGLAVHVGRTAAHEIVTAAARRAVESGVHLR
jgi:3-carboxy-cis,cis-muconate cycloisomerase